MPMQHSHILPLKVALIVPCFAAAVGIAFLISRDFPVLNAVVISACGAAVLAGMLILGSDKSLEYLQHVLSANPLWVLAIIVSLCGVYSIYSTATNTSGVIVTHAYLARPAFMITVVPTHSAMAASNWFAIPNIGQIVSILPVKIK